MFISVLFPNPIKMTEMGFKKSKNSHKDNLKGDKNSTILEEENT